MKTKGDSFLSIVFRQYHRRLVLTLATNVTLLFQFPERLIHGMGMMQVQSSWMVSRNTESILPENEGNTLKTVKELMTEPCSSLVLQK